jgi:guanine nucleotide-binding protein G(I)/G(S)/G(T) subunit beta-1
MASPKTASFVQLQQLSLTEKLQYIESAKAESDMLQHRIASIRREIRNTSLSQVSHSVPALINLKLSKPSLYKGHRGKINDMKLAHSSQTLVTVGQDGFAIIWDASTGSKMDFVQLANCWVLSCAISPSGCLIATGGLDNACTVYTVKNNFEDTSSISETDNLIPNNSNIGSSGIVRKNEGTNNYQMFALGPKAPVCLLKGHKAYISGMAFPLENKLLSSSGDMSINYWDLNRNERIFEFSDRNLGDVSSVAVHPTNPNVFVSGSLKTAKVWDVRVPISTQEFFGHKDDVNVVR